MSIPSCYSNIIGFSRKENTCLDGGIHGPWSASYATSDSGLYLDELPGMPQGFLGSLGGNYDIWEKMTNAMDNAIRAFKIDVLGEILKYKEPVRSRFKGEIGGKSFTTTLSDYSYHGLRMYSDVRGGSFILRGVYLILNVTEAITLNIYDEYDLLHSIALTSQAGRPLYNAITPITLPLQNEGSFSGNYYFLYQTSGLPYNNKLGCNCAGQKWCFDIVNPCYHYSRDAWTEWSMIAGVAGNVLADRDDWLTSREGAGMILNGEFYCDVLATLCTDDADWTTNEVNFAIAHAIWYKTGEFLATYIMDSEEVSRKTLLGVEQWNANRQFYNARYVTMINFIAENFEDERNECLKCREPLGYRKRSQLL